MAVLDPTRTGTVLAIVNVVLYSIMSLASWAGWGGWYEAAKTSPARVVTEAVALIAVNLAFGLLVVGGTVLLHPLRYRAGIRYTAIAGVAFLASVPRTMAMQAIYTTPISATFILGEWVAGFAAGIVAVAAGLFTAELVARVRSEADQRRETSRRAARAVEELQSEEMRVRRMVADRLHGTLQYQLVTVTAALDGIAERLDTGEPGRQAASDLREWADRLEQVREEEVRTLSHAIFPAGIELGTLHAIELMLRRLPPQIEAHLDVGPTLHSMVDRFEAALPSAERMIAIYTIEEAMTNALRHGGATQLWVGVEVIPTDDPTTWVLDLGVDDNGRGLAEPDPVLSGLSRHNERLEARGGTLSLGPSVRGGVRLHAQLPFHRPPNAAG
jgi:signal transduction histidine kinase